MFLKRSAFLLGGLVLASLIASQAHAEVDALVSNARSLLERGQAQQAFDLLEPQETPRAGDPDFDTVLGIAANETGQFTRAVFALERVLVVQPDNARARAELGRALFSVGDNKAARQVLQETKRQNIPAEAAKTIDEFLQAIDRNEEAERSSVKKYLEAGIGHDSNINSGPGNSNVAVPAFGGLIFSLTPAGVKTADSFYTLAGGLSGRYVVDPRLSLIGGVSGNHRGNFSKDGFDTTQIDLNAGASYRYEKHEFAVAGQFQTFEIDNTRARDQLGLVGEWTYRLDGFRQWNTYLQLSRLTYPNQRIRNADRHVLGTSYAHAFPSGVLLFGGGYIGSEDERASGVPQLGHKLWGLRAGGQKAISADLAAFGNVSYEDRRYNGRDPLFLLTRHDKQLTFNLGVSWVPAKPWRITPQVSFTSTKSNIAISDFNRTLVSVSARRDF